MLFTFALSSFLALVTAAPTASRSATTGSASSAVCHAKVFNQPWTLTDITVYKADGQDADDFHAAISFHFCDQNEGLEMQTDCSGTVINDRCEGEGGGYVACANETVGFKVASNLIMMERVYLDDCLGEYPYNSGQAFGENNTEMTSTQETSGTMWSQEQMLVHVTSQA